MTEDNPNLARFMALQLAMPALRQHGVIELPCTCPQELVKSINPEKSLWLAITHLNDGHAEGNWNDRPVWTREMIADWVDTLPLDLSVHP